jgi:aspartyl-tRNA(Asn)/glutamyl-tRNA(Gln) amidotransferase subunit A
VRRLRRAGAVIVGVTATDPGAFGVRTPAVTHPQAPERTVGGSSGGSGAALAAGFCFGALGSDTGGSIRIPAACCVIAGLKPTRGHLPLEGVRPLVWSLDHVGPMARRVADLSMLEQALDPRFAVPRRARRRRRIVIGHDPGYYGDAERAVRSGVEKALTACRDLGGEIREVSLPVPDEVIAIHGVIFSAESAAYYAAAFADRRDQYPPLLRHFLDLHKSYTGADYVTAMRQRREITQRVEALFAAADWLILPTLAVLTPPRDVETITVAGKQIEFTLALIRYTCLFDHTGHPVVAMPAETSGSGVGASIQVIGPLGRDADLLAFAIRLEQALGVEVDYGLRVE